MGLPLEKLALEAFLEWENAEDTRNEFYRGDVFPQADARRSHGTVHQTWCVTSATRWTARPAAYSTKA